MKIKLQYKIKQMKYYIWRFEDILLFFRLIRLIFFKKKEDGELCNRFGHQWVCKVCGKRKELIGDVWQKL